MLPSRKELRSLRGTSPGVAAFIVCLMMITFSASAQAQAISTATNALDRIDFGDTGTDPFSESAHAFVNMGNPTGIGALGLTWREIAPSTTAANIGNPAYNKVLTFSMICSPNLQNYLTLRVWGSDTIEDAIYLYTPSQGYLLSNYFETPQPQLDYQQTADPLLPGRFVYETIPIPLAMTTGQTSVSLTLNAAQSFAYYSGATGNLPAGATSRPIYSAFTHTNPYLIPSATDPVGVAPTIAAATPATYSSAYLNSIVNSLSTYVGKAASNQVFGPTWTSAVAAGSVPAQIIGYFDSGKSPSNSYTLAQWLNNAAIDTSASNNVAMERLDALAFAYVTPSFLTPYYKASSTEQAIVAALDAYSYMQALNGCYGDMTAWDGLGAVASTNANPQGRANAQCSPIEGAGTWALGSAIVQMKGDSSFLAALNQPMNATLEPGVLRYQAYQTMLANHIAFLTGSIGHGHAPNQDLLQAKAYLYANLALRALDTLYGTSLARSNAAMYTDYLNIVAGLAPNIYGGVWISKGGLGLEVNGTGYGSYDGGYGLVDELDLVWLAKILNDNGVETSASAPVRNVALNAVHAFSNFIYPSVVASGSNFISTLREEEVITFRKDENIGEVQAGGSYYAAAEFADPTALHAFYLEHANGITWAPLAFGAGSSDDTNVEYMHEFADYSALCNLVNTTADTTGITLLNEPAHADGVFADPTGSTLAIRHGSERLDVVLNYRPLPVTGKQPVSGETNWQTVNNVARIHDTSATSDRLATVDMPATAATGASGSYTSGSYATFYLGRYGNYLMGLNWQNTSANMSFAPDMTSGTLTDIATGANYDLTKTSVVSVPALSGVALFQSLPTATLSAPSVGFGAISTSSASQTVTLSNTGSGPLLISAMALNGTNASDYTYTTTCGVTLAAAATCSFAFTFTPSGTGTRSATFSLTTCLSTTAQTVTLSGSSTQFTLIVAAGNATRFFDTPNPTPTYTLTGFVGTDTQANSTTGAPSLVLSATRNSPAGNYAIVTAAGTLASSKYLFQFFNGTLTVTGNAPQRIAFPPLANVSSGSTLRLLAIASSGLPVAFTVVSGPATLSGTLLTVTGAGTVVVSAAQAGDGTYAAATLVTRSLTAQ